MFLSDIKFNTSLFQAGFVCKMIFFSGDLLGHVFNLTNYNLIYDRLSSVFPEENILVINSDKLIEDPQPEIKKNQRLFEPSIFFRHSELPLSKG